MTTVAMGGTKGSPGATTTVLALAAVWPASRPVLVVELDPDGGVIAARRGLGAEPGLVGAIAAARRDGGVVADHAQPLGDNVDVLVAPSCGRQADAAVAAALAPPAAPPWTVAHADVVIDCGRLRPGSPTLPAMAAADVALLVMRPTLADVSTVRALMPQLRLAGAAPQLALIDGGPYRPDAVADAVGAEIAVVLPADRRTADALNGHAPAQGLRRSRLLRAARQLHADIESTTERADSTTGVVS